MMFDKITQVGISAGIPPTAVLTNLNTPYVSTILDLQDKYAAAFILATGVNTDADATFAVTMDESDASNMAGSNAVAAGDLILTLASAGYTFADDGEVRKIGYKGMKRYIRVTVTPTGNNAGDSLLAGVWVWHGHIQPVAQPT
jgi:hypothetical protein